MSDKDHLKFYVKIVLITSFLLLTFVTLSHADEWAIKTIAYESSRETFKGQVAVASVIKTRMKELHKTAKQIVLKPFQFSCWKNGQPTQKRKLTKKELLTAKKAWEQARPSTYNHYAHYKINNYWTKKALSKKRIGDHIFYKL